MNNSPDHMHQSDMVLVMDVARFKYPPHWVQLNTMWQAMKSVDKTANRSRGYSMLKLHTPQTPLMLLSMPNSLLKCNGLWKATDQWINWLIAEADAENDESLLEATAIRCVSVFQDELLDVVNSQLADLMEATSCCDADCHATEREHLRKCGHSVMSELRQLPLHHVIKSHLSASSSAQPHNSVSLVSFVLSWPYSFTASIRHGCEQSQCRIRTIQTQVDTVITRLTAEAKAEIDRLNVQLKVALINRQSTTDNVVCHLAQLPTCDCGTRHK